jgi:hypothetical protein
MPLLAPVTNAVGLSTPLTLWRGRAVSPALSRQRRRGRRPDLLIHHDLGDLEIRFNLQIATRIHHGIT